MFEKVNPKHPDKVADRIAGAIVDLAYTKCENPKIAVEVLIGHGKCHIIAETSEHLENEEIKSIVLRICGGNVAVIYDEVPQDEHLANNQAEDFRCGDNGIFKGMPITDEQRALTSLAHAFYDRFDSDSKYILNDRRLTVCQSNASENCMLDLCAGWDSVVNPLGDWTGGTDVDTGATNRKLGSDMGDAVTGGGLHGKDLSKADVSVNIYAHIKAQQTGKPCELFCAIGDTQVDDMPYSAIVDIARDYIHNIGGFEKFAEWGLIR